MNGYNLDDLRNAIRLISLAEVALRLVPVDIWEIADAADQLSDIQSQLIAFIPPWCGQA